jgi:hypothetical protein
MSINTQLRDEILWMIKQDGEIRADLASTGELFQGYHPLMAAIHGDNATRLNEIVERHGWPDREIVGDEGSEAAWRIVQHAIAQPDFQRRMLKLLEAKAAEGKIELWQPAYLEDRIRSLEGRPQRYGTQFDWNENGEMSPYPAIEDPENVNQLRASVGLNSLEEQIRRTKHALAESNELPPRDFHKRQAEMDAWASSVGWRKKD